MNRLLAETNDSKLPDHDQLAAFVLACGLSEEQWREWAWVCADIQSTGGDSGLGVYPALLERFRRTAPFSVGGLVATHQTFSVGGVAGAAPTFTLPTPPSLETPLVYQVSGA